MKKKILNSLLIFFSSLILISCGANSNDENVITLFTWNDYIDPQTLKNFTKETGIKVNVEFFSNNEDMLAKLENNPSYFDVITPSDFIVDKLIQEDQLALLNYDNIPNAKYLIEEIRNPSFDIERQYALPYAWGTVGIIYDTTKVEKPITSWKSLWDPKYKGSIIMTDSIRDTVGVALLAKGYSLNTQNPKELLEAGELLAQQKPLVMGYIGDATENLMATGEATMAVLWSGDAVNAIRKNPNMTYVIPEEGSNLWEDDFIIPKNSSKKELAEAFINYMYKPEVALESWEFIGYSTPNQETLSYLPEEEQNDKRFYPDLPNPKLERMRHIDDKTLETYNEVWLLLKS